MVIRSVENVKQNIKKKKGKWSKLMPSKCSCPRCEKFRAREENQPRITQATFLALQKANMPSLTSRRSLIKAGKGKSGGKD